MNHVAFATLADISAEKDVYREPFETKLGGIGQGTATVHERVCLPDVTGQLHAGFWKTQQLEGIGNKAPPLLGLDAILRNKWF